MNAVVEISVADIRKGDSFVRRGGRMFWTASGTPAGGH